MSKSTMWKGLKLYKNGKVVSTSSEYIDNHNIHTFYLIARFKDYTDAEIFAQMKSKKNKFFSYVQRYGKS